MNDPSFDSAIFTTYDKIRWVLAAAVVCFAFLLQGILLPFAFKTKPLSDFFTIYHGTNDFWNAEKVYGGANPYLPGIYVLMGWQAIVSPSVAWTLWRAMGVAVLASMVWAGLLSPELPRNWFVRCLCIANILLLAGMSPRWGNPGNVAGMLVVLGWFLMTLRQAALGGLVMGIAAVLKYNIGLPFLVVVVAARQARSAVTALVVWAILTATGFAVTWYQGCRPQEVLRSVALGIQHVGGYDDVGFDRWFASTNRYRFQLLSVTPLLHDIGIRRDVGNAIALLCGLLGGVAAVERARRRGGLAGLAMAGPAILLFTYHRFYDSAILAFCVLAAWQHATQRRPGAWLAIVASCAIFFNVSNIAQTSLGLPMNVYDSLLWRFGVGPHHIYCLIVMLIWAVVAAYTDRSDGPGQAWTMRRVGEEQARGGRADG